jgi:hypothetical protein
MESYYDEESLKYIGFLSDAKIEEGDGIDTFTLVDCFFLHFFSIRDLDIEA